MDKRWCAEDLTKATIRAVEALHSFATTRNVELLMTYTRKRLFSSPVLAYCLPLLRAVLQDQGSRVKGEEKARQEALQLMLLHCKLRRVQEDDNEAEVKLDAMMLPRKQMLSVLSDVIVEAEGHNKEAKIQQSAAVCIVELCKFGNSFDSHMPDAGVIVSLTNNLVSMCPVLRHCSLEGLRCLVSVFPEHGTDERELLAARVLLAKYDVEEKNRQLAEM